jgi:hypothetical protein
VDPNRQRSKFQRSTFSAPDLAAVAQEMVGEHAGHHGFAELPSVSSQKG